jgi:peptidoglycan/LPS O-acetylase OafA/YrhL
MESPLNCHLDSFSPPAALGAQLSRHLPPLDGIRGLAILMVTLYRFSIGPEYTELPGSLLFKVLRRGDLGVDLFFVLSGFLITGILFDAKGREGYFRNFYARRALRIFPLYYGFLFVTLVATPALFGLAWELFPEAQAHQAWLWPYAANLLLARRNAWCLGSFDHFWSLSVEEHFYLLWPLVIFFCSRATAIVVSLAAVAVAVIGRMVCARLGGDVAAETFTFFHMDGLALGGFLALAARGQQGIERLVPWAYAGIFVCTAALFGLWQVQSVRLPGLPLFIVAGFLGALLVLAVASRPTTWWGALWRSKVLGFFGKYSYAMYVFQLPLIALLSPEFTAEGVCSRTGSVFWGRLAYTAMMMAITTGSAFASWHLYEKHFLAFKTKFKAAASDGRRTAFGRGPAQAVTRPPGQALPLCRTGPPGSQIPR